MVSGISIPLVGTYISVKTDSRKKAVLKVDCRITDLFRFAQRMNERLLTDHTNDIGVETGREFLSQDIWVFVTVVQRRSLVYMLILDTGICELTSRRES